MAKVMITEAYLEDIADAIREKKRVATTYYPSQMAEAIASIEGEGSGGSGGNVWQDAQGYVHLDDEGTTPITVEPLSVTQNGTYTAPTGKAYSPVTVNVSGGGDISGFATGTLTVPSTRTSTTTIVSEAEIGFVPTKFMFYKNEDTTTDKAIRAATYIGIGTTYIRTRSVYAGQSAAATTAANYTEWTSSSSGFLYKNDSGTISISATSLYNLTAGTYTWWAMK